MDQKSLRELVPLIRKLSYREGDYTLVSGKKAVSILISNRLRFTQMELT